MTGGDMHFGDNIHINGGSHHIGKQEITYGGTDDRAVRDALALLLIRVDELRERLPGASGAVVDASLPAVADVGALPAERAAAARTVAGIAAAIGAVGTPVVEAANALIALFGG
ncbi:hypothetical protein [Streptomyces avicenniae]|uniref:hypothetical protein n=1 Tax=Streptomyces avicenniae TaxID=500153 RepID=UPI00069C7FC1|nr:hypothetical protein [Streptomyces avicenniae]